MLPQMVKKDAYLKMSTGQRAVMLCSREKACMARVWWAGKTVWSLVLNRPYFSALEVKLLGLSALQIHVYFTYYIYYIKDMILKNEKWKHIVDFQNNRPKTTTSRHIPAASSDEVYRVQVASRDESI